MANIIQSPWTASIIGMLAYLGTTVAVFPSISLPEEHSAASTNAPLKEFSWMASNYELEQLVEELRATKQELSTKKAQLEDLEARIKTERLELNQVTSIVQQLQKEFDSNILRVKEEETANLKKLSKLYSTMAPDAAAAVFKKLDDQTVVKLMLFMKEPESAPILEAMARGGEEDAARVAAIGERRRLAIPPKPPKTTQ